MHRLRVFILVLRLKCVAKSTIPVMPLKSSNKAALVDCICQTHHKAMQLFANDLPNQLNRTKPTINISMCHRMRKRYFTSTFSGKHRTTSIQFGVFSFWTLSHTVPLRCVDDLMLELNFGLKQRDRLFAFLALKRVHTRNNRNTQLKLLPVRVLSINPSNLESATPKWKKCYTFSHLQ